MEVAAQSADDDAPQPRSSSSMEYAPASHRVDERQRRLHVGNADAERQPQSAHIAGETDNESARRPDTRQYVAASTGTGKTHLAIAIARSCIRAGARGRFYNVVDLVNRLERLMLARKATGADAWNEVAAAVTARLGRDTKGVALLQNHEDASYTGRVIPGRVLGLLANSMADGEHKPTEQSLADMRRVEVDRALSRDSGKGTAEGRTGSATARPDFFFISVKCFICVFALGCNYQTHFAVSFRQV